MHSVRLHVAGVCLGVFALFVVAGSSAWSQADTVWSGRGEATGRGTEAELRARAIDNGRQRALASWLKARLETTLFNEYSKDLQRTILLRPQQYIKSEKISEVERPSAQTVRLTVQASFDETALEASLRAGGFLRPWSGRKQILTYALHRSDEDGYAMASTSAVQVQDILRVLASQEFSARGVTEAASLKLQAMGSQVSEATIARALPGAEVHLVWLLSGAGARVEAYAVLRPEDRRSGRWNWQSWDGEVSAVSVQPLIRQLSHALNALDQPWEHWILLSAPQPGPDLLARASKLAEVAVFDEVTPVRLSQANQQSQLWLRFYSLANTREVETQLRQRLRPATLQWSQSASGRPLATLGLDVP